MQISTYMSVHEKIEYTTSWSDPWNKPHLKSIYEWPWKENNAKYLLCTGKQKGQTQTAGPVA